MEKEEILAQIKEFVALSKLEEALMLLENISPDTIYLQQIFNAAKKENRMGIIDNEEWSRKRNKIAFSILELAENI